MTFLKAITEISEPSRAALSTWLTSLSEVTERVDELDSGSNTTEKFFPVLNTILAHGVATAVPYEDLIDVDTCVTNVAGSQAFPVTSKLREETTRRRLLTLKNVDITHRHLTTNETLLNNVLNAGMNVSLAANGSEASKYASYITAAVNTCTLA